MNRINMIAITLIVPVYNVEKYLVRCLDSCLHQDLDEDEYEIIAVNDGSYDGSLKLLKEYANRYRNIVLIDKPNGGLSSARNAGLERARGNFIWVVDSDDWIAENCLKTVCRLFDNNNIDMITFNTYYATNIGYKEQAVKRDMVDGQILDGVQLYNQGFIYPFTGVPFYIYRSSFLRKHNLRFVDKIYFEDWLFTPIAYVYCDKCLYWDNFLYYYYMRTGSITQSVPTVKKAEDIIEIAERLYTETASVKRERSMIIYKSIACLTKSFYAQWYYLSKTERLYLRKAFLTKSFWIKSILYSAKLKYIAVVVSLLLNIRVMHLAKYNFQNK